MHRAIDASEAGSAEQVRAVRALLRLWAVPELRIDTGQDAYQLARERNLLEVQALLREQGLAFGPRQSREARAAGIRDICLWYDKARGFIYRIGEPHLPFLAGGDHDGPRPCAGLAVLGELDLVRRLSGRELGWLEPFLQAVLRGREFALDTLLENRDRFSMHRFDARSSWSRLVP